MFVVSVVWRARISDETYHTKFANTFVTHINPFSRPRQILNHIAQPQDTRIIFLLVYGCKHFLVSFTQDVLTIPVMLASCLFTIPNVAIQSTNPGLM